VEMLGRGDWAKAEMVIRVETSESLRVERTVELLVRLDF
jgi:hypothetical protein